MTQYTDTTINPHHSTLTIGLTGGIGCGKTTVMEGFAHLGVPVIDADQLARDLVVPGSPALNAIIESFGAEFLNSSGHLDRARLRERIFQDSAARRRLESILHPQIRAEMVQWKAERTEPYCIMVIPLLFEAGQQDMVDRILVVDCPPQLQRERIAARDGLPRQQIEDILSTQWDRKRRLEGANDVIVNQGNMENLGQELNRLHQNYLALAEQIHGN